MLLATPAPTAPVLKDAFAVLPPTHESFNLKETDLAWRWDMNPKTLQRWRMEGRGPSYLKLGILADNRLAENAGWDDELLKLELAELKAADFDLDLMGFSDKELEDLLNGDESGGGLTEDDAIPEAPVDPVSRPGDLWILGNHRLLCGDSTVLSDVRSQCD